MFGEGVSMLDLMALLKAIREKNLVLQVKIIDKPWEDLSGKVVKAMIEAVTTGLIKQSSDIRLRLSEKSAAIHP
ncbi:Uncharacterised protein [uncultured archaeon]|nr:Uncharacterised protein [uncultured archaeon]